MDSKQLTAMFQKLSGDQKLHVWVSLAHALTVVSRECYQPGTTEVADPKRLRRINEVLHRVTAASRAILDHAAGYPDDVLIEMIAEEEDASVQRELESSITAEASLEVLFKPWNRDVPEAQKTRKLQANER